MCVSNDEDNHFYKRYSCTQDLQQVKCKDHWKFWEKWHQHNTTVDKKVGAITGTIIYLHLIHDSQLTQSSCMQKQQEVHSMVKLRAINIFVGKLH